MPNRLAELREQYGVTLLSIVAKARDLGEGFSVSTINLVEHHDNASPRTKARIAQVMTELVREQTNDPALTITVTDIWPEDPPAKATRPRRKRAQATTQGGGNMA